MNDELTVLAETGAAALVTAMATELWQGARDAVVGLFRRDAGGEPEAIEAQLDRNAALVAESAEPDDVRRTLFRLWTLELAACCAGTPPAWSGRPARRRGGGRTPGSRRGFLREHYEQTNIANESGTVLAVQHGDLHNTPAGPGGSPNGAARADRTPNSPARLGRRPPADGDHSPRTTVRPEGRAVARRSHPALRRADPVGAVERLVDPVGAVLRVEDDRVLGGRVAELVDRPRSAELIVNQYLLVSGATFLHL